MSSDGALFICILEMSTTISLPDSGVGVAMTVTRLQLVSVRVIADRWSTNLDVFFISFDIYCIVIIKDE